MIGYPLIHNTTVGTATIPEFPVGWTKEEIEPEAELHMAEIEDEFSTLPKWTHTSRIIPTYRTGCLHAEMDHLRGMAIRHAIHCLPRAMAFRL